MGRAIAICEGGPLDGRMFSVELSPDGTPEPLHSREELLGVLYRPVSPAGPLQDIEERFYSDLHGSWGSHESAYTYAVEEAD